MRRFVFVPVVALAAVLLFAPTQLRADGFDNFTFTDTTSNNSFSLVLAFQLPSTPTPGFAISGQGFEMLNVSVSEVLNGVDMGTQLDTMAFFNPSSGAPVQFIDLFASLTGSSIMYSGDETNPTFIPGTYTGFDFLNLDSSGAPASATLSIVSTPEPSSILMLLTGFLVLAGALTVKKAAA